MSRMSDAEYELMKDCRDKKITARSARHTRTHCGKSGPVRFPSDYLTEKERRKLNGECKSYRLNAPMTWEDFKELPNDLKQEYIKAIHHKYKAPIGAIAEMMGTHRTSLSRMISDLNLNVGKFPSGPYKWDTDGFVAWCRGEKVTEVIGYPTTKKEIEDIEKEHTPPTKEDIAKFAGECESGVKKYPHGGSYDIPQFVVPAAVVPNNGTLTFEDNARNILRTLNDILQNEKVRLSVQWTIVTKDDTSPVMLDTDALKKAGTIIDYAILNEQRKERLGTKG